MSWTKTLLVLTVHLKWNNILYKTCEWIHPAMRAEPVSPSVKNPKISGTRWKFGAMTNVLGSYPGNLGFLIQIYQIFWVNKTKHQRVKCAMLKSGSKPCWKMITLRPLHVSLCFQRIRYQCWTCPCLHLWEEVIPVRGSHLWNVWLIWCHGGWRWLPLHARSGHRCSPCRNRRSEEVSTWRETTKRRCAASQASSNRGGLNT